MQVSNAREALVILSGGQDSTTCLAQAVARRGAARVACITFVYGQRHQQEVAVARAVARHFGVTRHLVLDVTSGYQAITHSALLEARGAFAPVPGASYPDSVVDGRNMLFLLLAAIHAKQLGIHDLILGVSEADSSGYPDCRAAFVHSCNQTLKLAMDYDFQVLTPLMELDKAAVWALADTLGVLDYISAHTLTCYNGVMGAGCGACPACALRRRGYEQFRAQQNMKDES